ncbi:MAG TPA: hypothetical protein P5511_04980, partial [Candidatus Goldiibacteriota bacterium]|nr:hypothetical protein [Candidatus Goldiibacteriota bacterium]
MKKKDLFVSLGFLAFTVIIFLPLFISDKFFSWLDFAYYFMPFRHVPAEMLKNGELPLWNPYIYCGNPLLANMQSAVLYPLNIFYYALPYAAALKAQTLTAFFIASFSMYVLARAYSFSRPAALISAAAFAFSFYMTVRAVELADLHTIIWLPAALYFAKKAGETAKARDIVMLSLSLSLAFLAGHPQVFSYIYLMAASFFAYYSYGKRPAGRSAVNFILFNVLFAGLVSCQLLPGLEFILLSKRAYAGVGLNVHLSTFSGIEQ